MLKIPNINALYEICLNLNGSFLSKRISYYLFHLITNMGKPSNKQFTEMIEELKLKSEVIGVSFLAINIEREI